jgi:hypothetical protein
VKWKIESFAEMGNKIWVVVCYYYLRTTSYYLTRTLPSSCSLAAKEIEDCIYFEFVMDEDTNLEMELEAEGSQTFPVLLGTLGKNVFVT